MYRAQSNIPITLHYIYTQQHSSPGNQFIIEYSFSFTKNKKKIFLGQERKIIIKGIKIDKGFQNKEHRCMGEGDRPGGCSPAPPQNLGNLGFIGKANFYSWIYPRVLVRIFMQIVTPA